MDFKRIEWIFFLAFLGLNIFFWNLSGRSTRGEQRLFFQPNRID